jgi:tight adherence protein B
MEQIAEIAVFLAVLVLVFALAWHLFALRAARRDVAARLIRLHGLPESGATGHDLIRANADNPARLADFPPFRLWSRLLRQSGVQLTARKIALFALAVGVPSLLLALWLMSGGVMQALLALVLAFAATLGVLLRLRAQRIARFLAQMPGAIEVIIRSVNSGHPLTAALYLVGREMAEPIGSEFLALSEQLTFGADLDQSVSAMVDKVGVEEMTLLAVTLTVQSRSGGSLSEVLENLADMIRERVLMRAKIRAISAEGRVTAVLMAMFPFILFLIVRTLMPDYFDPLWASGYGPILLTVLGMLMLVGVLILYRLVNFDF